MIERPANGEPKLRVAVVCVKAAAGKFGSVGWFFLEGVLGARDPEPASISFQLVFGFSLHAVPGLWLFKLIESKPEPADMLESRDPGRDPDRLAMVLRMIAARWTSAHQSRSSTVTIPWGCLYGLDWFLPCSSSCR